MIEEDFNDNDFIFLFLFFLYKNRNDGFLLLLFNSIVTVIILSDFLYHKTALLTLIFSVFQIYSLQYSCNLSLIHANKVTNPSSIIHQDL